MLTKTLKEIKKEIEEEHGSSNFPFLLHTNMDYPDIPDNESNFFTDYMANEESFNTLILRKRGFQVADFDDSEDNYSFYYDWYYLIDSITSTYLDAWARLYYALSLSYNPIWNVDGATVTERDAIENSNEYGEQIVTSGDRSDSTTYHSVSYDSSTEKETGKDAVSIGEQENTYGEHTDTINLGEQKETVTRSGNQGITMTQTMLNEEWKFRQKAFFEHILNTVLDEIGFYYNGGVRV